MFSVKELINITNAQVLKNDFKDELLNISTDTRTIKVNDIYLPLKGENFDGENFIENALNSGANAYFTTQNNIFNNAKLVLKVPDTKIAYMQMASFYRKKINPITVAITGSSGKTTTKEMIYSVLNYKFKTQKTFSNHNNEIGFCQTVLSMDKDTEVLIVEMGMRGLGEIEFISKYLEPDYAVITNCGTAHIGRLGSKDNIAIAKCEITKGLKKDGTFISLDQEIIKKHLNFDGEKIFYSIDDVEILKKSQSYSKFLYKPTGAIFELNVEGDYNIENSLAAIDLGYKLGMTAEEINEGLKSYHPIEKRWEVENINGYKFINDSYNANPESMKASIKTFIELYKNPVVILGDMGELGTDEVKYHVEVGEFLSKNCINKNVKYIFIGNLAKNIAKPLKNEGFSTVCFDKIYDVIRYIVENINKSNTIFLKASRSMKLERILDGIRDKQL